MSRNPFTNTIQHLHFRHIPPPRALVQVMAYADDITMTSTHTSTSAVKKYMQPYLHSLYLDKTKQLNPDKTTFTLFIPDHAEYKSNLDLKIKQHYTTHGNAPKGSGPYPRAKTHIHNISVQAHKPLQMIKALKATGWV